MITDSIALLGQIFTKVLSPVLEVVREDNIGRV